MTTIGRGPSIDRRRFLVGAGGAALAGVVAGCGSSGPGDRPAGAAPAPPPGSPTPPSGSVGPIDLQAAPAAVVARATVPVLCWHQLRDWRPDDSASARTLFICPPANFRAQLDAVVGAGYTPIGPDAYLAHLTTGAPLPPKPILLSFDDSQGSQMTVGLPELMRRGLTATFFVMTVPLDKPDWMTRDDVRRLRDAGMTVAAHTYDHHRVDRYTGDDWKLQLDQPRAELERILGAPVRHFAYPFGAWNPAGFEHVTAAGYWTAFQLADKPIDTGHPLLTLRRTLVTSTWTGPQVLGALARPV